jgi:hypothetical protein
LGRHRRGNAVRAEERRGSEKDRLARAAGRGREDASPALLQFGVLGAVALLVLVILVVAMVLWAILR